MPEQWSTCGHNCTALLYLITGIPSLVHSVPMIISRRSPPKGDPQAIDITAVNVDLAAINNLNACQKSACNHACEKALRDPVT